MRAREANPDDWIAIEALIQRAQFDSPALWKWETHLTDRGFIVVEEENRIEGALFASADESPAAWVRLAAMSAELNVRQWLDLSLPPILDHLRTRGIEQLTWMDRGGWAAPFLASHGFHTLTEVVTLTKTDHVTPPIETPAVTLRPASQDDLGAVAAIDREAFTPTWWRSEATVRRRAATASRFTVADRRGDVVGYAERELHPPKAHLNRIAVCPDSQGQGIGAGLLKHVLVSLWEAGAESVSLNTQRSNRRSRRLYSTFGFELTGDAVLVWALQL